METTNESETVTAVSALLEAATRVRRAMTTRSKSDEIRRLGTSMMGALTSERSSVKVRLIKGKAKACAEALERWGETRARREAEIERAVESLDEKGMVVLEKKIMDDLLEFERYLEDEEVLEALPRAVADITEKTSEPERGTIETMHRVLGDADEASARALDCLCSELSAIEVDPAWRGRLMAEVQRSAAENGWSAGNFAYGSTSFSTWSELFARCDALRARARTLDDEDFVVFGSSAGWLVFYAAATLRARAYRGFEILQTLHDTALRALANFEHHTSSKIDFIRADMLSASLQSVGLIVLTSLCWDEAVYEACARKLARELPLGALVIDYRDALGRHDAFTRLTDDPIRLPVSWNPRQAFYVFAKTT